MPDSQPSSSTPSRGLSGLPLFLAVAALALWAAFAVMMLANASSASDLFWTRLAFVFASVEAIAFGAAGAIWGVTVNKQRAENAERRADEQTQQAANGRALAATTIADAATVVDDGGTVRSERLAGSPGSPTQADLLRRHAQIARALFPDI